MTKSLAGDSDSVADSLASLSLSMFFVGVAKGTSVGSCTVVGIISSSLLSGYSFTLEKACVVSC